METAGVNKKAKEVSGEYKTFLDSRGIATLKSGPYLFHGNAMLDNRWLLFISLTVLEFRSRGPLILSQLAKKKVAFRIPINTLSHYQINTGELGEENTGRVIVIYPIDGKTASMIATDIIALTRDAEGIAVPDAIYLGGKVYAAYSKQSEKEKGTFRITLPQKHPFSGEVVYPPAPKRFIGKGYVPARIIKTGPKGDIIQAVNVRKLSFTWCLVKQGKAYAADDEYGRDIRHRLLWQWQLLTRLQGLCPVPKVVDYFENKTGTYLVTEFLEGQPLNEVFAKLLAGKSYNEASKENKTAILMLFSQLTDILARLHDAGIVHRDITAANLIKDKRDQLHLIDFELAFDLKKCEPFPPFVHGTFGYVAPEQASYSTPSVKEDIYSLGAMIYFGLTYQQPKDSLLIGKPEALTKLPISCSSPALVAIVQKMLRNNPFERPSIAAIQEVLDRELNALKDSPIARKAITLPHKAAIELVTGLLFLFLAISGGSKLFNLQQFGYDMNSQPIADWLKPILTQVIPYGHLLLAGLILGGKTRFYGLLGILAVISGYLLYIMAIRMDFFAFQPCSCTWVYKKLGYEQTFALNLIFWLWTVYLVASRVFDWMANKLSIRKRSNLQKRRVKFIHEITKY
ncbi:protein kinase [Parapedobacter sp. ISTM3]|uniref:serine/threonine protein kinase n=1 Tax=Parapedobacter sp. ISTM3 TaxID=2800130 RepID=UPI0019071E0A|nr:MauE/DoxX family redox-associated membrane protein [Parapedobacter sp. ISTM3]MBK1439820.1 protein kinase [Parapedobacter sp. ISTM3]